MPILTSFPPSNMVPIKCCLSHEPCDKKLPKVDKILNQYQAVPFGTDLMYCYEKKIMYQKENLEPFVYDKDYFDSYVQREGTDIAIKLNQSRAGLVEKYCKCVLDIGIGSGEFIKSVAIKAYGFDVNAYGIQWLQERNIYVDPYKDIPADVDGVSLWDALEHMEHPSDFIDLIGDRYVFISLPIFKNILTIRSSKHFKPREHLIYFEADGLIAFMADCGYWLVEISDGETLAGRESVLAFVFKKLK